MQLEPHASVSLVMVLALLFALLVLVLWWTRRTYPGFNRWSAAGILLVAALCLLALRGLAPDWASVVCADSLIVIASILYLEGARQFLGLRPRNWLTCAGGFLAVIAVAFFDYVVPSLNARGTVMSSFMAIIFIITAIRLLKAIPPQHKFGMTLTGSMFALCAALLLARALYFQFASPLSDSTVYFGISGALVVAIVAALVCIGVGIVLLADERVVSDMYDAREAALRAKLEVNERRQREGVLRESLERFQTVANAAPVMIWASGPDKLCMFFNKPWLDFTGRSMEQELGNGWAEGVYPEDLDRCLATYNSSFEIRHRFQMEYRLRRSDGEYRWIMDHGTPLYQKGEFAGFIGSCIDVTEQKLMAERLLAQKVQLADAQRLANLGSWERDLDDCGFDCSEEFLRILGLQGKPPGTLWDFLQYVHPKDRHSVSQSALEIRSSGSPVEMSYRIVRPSGEVRFVRSIVQAIRDHRGKPVRAVGAMQDITEQLRSAELLRENEKRLKNAERLAHLGNWYWDLRSNKVSWSEEMFRIFGQPQDYTPSYEGFFQAVLPQDRERVGREVRDSLANKGEVFSEVQIARPDGELRVITFIAEVLLDEEGQPASFFGACQDITEERRAQEETVARQKLESIGTLASGIAHDFNNLLGGVLAQTELALSELSAGINPEQELKAILDVAIRGSEIVRELMIYAGKESAVVGLVDVSRIVKEMLELLKVSVSKHAVVETDLDEDLPAVRANAAQLRQVVMNLVTNASEAIGHRDGVIRVTTSRVKVGKESSEGISDRLAAGDYVKLTVSDTGRGMPRGTQARVFDPFFTTKALGHGLGLSIVHGIVTGLGGAIHLTSEPDKGTTFEILLPWAKGTAETFNGPMPASEEPARPAQSATILVVEDEDALRKAVGRMLRKIGFEVLEAANGSAAIDLLRTSGSKIDVVLLDLTVPGASSTEVVAAAAKARPDLKVVLTSAYSEEMATPTWSTPLIHGFIRKPYRFGDLAQTLRDALPS